MRHVFGRSTLAVTLFVAVGCHSIQSDAVRQLIDREADKINTAQQNIEAFVTATDLRVGAYQNAVKDLNSSLEEVRKVEAVQALVFSSNQNVETKTGVDAQAVAYMVCKIYLVGGAGLEQRVKTQFADDEAAMKSIAKELKDSWTSLAGLQKEISAYSKRTGVASVDPQFVSAVIAQVPGAPEDVDSVLKRGRQLNEAVQQAIAHSPVSGEGLDYTGTLSADLVKLLENVKASPARQPQPQSTTKP